MDEKSILVLYTGDDFNKKQPNHKAGMRNMYSHWYKVANARGYQLLRASVHWFANGRFNKYWRHVGDGTWEKKEADLVPTIVYDKTVFLQKKTGYFMPKVYETKLQIARTISMINQPEFTVLVDNKLNQAAIFYKYMPKARFYRRGEVAHNPRKKIMVLKKLYGSGGKTVDITRASRYRFVSSTIEQEFIAAKHNGQLKDLRIVFNGDDPRYAYNRLAKSRSLFTNVHQGAKTLWVELNDIPDVIDLARQITKPLRVFPKRIYALDFLIETASGRPFLIEANTMPGFSVFRTAANKTPQEREKLIETYLNYLTDYLIS